MIHSRPYDVVMLGLGYIGLPTAAVIARSGLRVRGVDINQATVDTINDGRVHIEERDLDALVKDVVSRGLLSASTEVPEADTFLIAVPTPLAAKNEPDVSHVFAALDLIIPRLRRGDCIILESTSPIGTTEGLAARLAAARPDLCIPGHCDDGTHDIHIAYCPERVLPGQIIAELVSNDRVIGGLTPSCSERAGAFYRRFVEGACLPTTAGAAEMVKLAENSFRDVNIAFANELSIIAEDHAIDVWDVIRLANRHPRVNILQPGPGVGGHCIAVDPWFLAAGSAHAPLIRTARSVNDAKALHVARQLKAMLDERPDASMALLGLTFKPNIDDTRESPALQIAERLADEDAERLLIVEPFLAELPATLRDTKVRHCGFAEAMERAELVAVLVDHTEFRDAPRSVVSGKQIYDTRGVWS